MQWIVVLGLVMVLAVVYSYRRHLGPLLAPLVRRLNDEQVIGVEIALLVVVPALAIGGILAAFRFIRHPEVRRGFRV
jgi:hypothetical protein